MADSPYFDSSLPATVTFFCSQDGRYGEIHSVVFLSFTAISIIKLEIPSDNSLTSPHSSSSPSNIEKCSRCLARKQERLNTGYSPPCMRYPDSWALESRIQLQESGIKIPLTRNPQSSIWNINSQIFFDYLTRRKARLDPFINANGINHFSMLSNATIECYLSACSSRFQITIGRSKVHQHKSKASNDIDRNDCTLPGYKTLGQGVSLWCDDTLKRNENTE